MTPPPFALSLFGPPRLVGPHGPLPAASPRRLAVLAVIAAAGPAGITRDRLVGLLWPEADQARARHSLNQTLYALRRDAQRELTIGSGDLRLDTAAVACDVDAFDRAVADGRTADALAAYAGPFLDGFYIQEAPEFGHWVDVERDRRARQAFAAAEAVAKAAEGSGGNAGAAWMRAAELDPYNSRAARHVVEALARAGDRAGALRYGEQHAARVARELEAPMDPALVALLESLRAPIAVARPVAPATVPVAPAPAPAPPPPLAPLAPARVSSPDRVSAPMRVSAGVPAARASFIRRRWPWLAAAGVALAAGAAAFRPSVNFARGEYIVIGEFANLTSDTLLSRVTTTAFTAALAQSNWVAPLPHPRIQDALRRMRRPDTTTLTAPDIAREVAVREHIPLFVTGQVMQAGADLQVVTQLVEAETGRILRSRTQRVASRDKLLGAIDALAADLRRDLGEARASVQESVPLPTVTTSSLEALRLYAEAVRLDERHDGGSASDRLQSAIQLDSNFARARAAYGAFLVLNNRLADAEPHLVAAERLAAALPPSEGLPVLAQVQRARGDYGAAASSLRSYLARYPQDAEAWRSYASALRRADDGRGALAAYDSAARRMPLSSGDYMELAALWLGEVERAGGGPTARAAADSARRQYERAFALDSTLLTYLYVNHQYGSALVRIGANDSARAVFARMLAKAPDDRARGMRSLGYLEAWEGRWRSASRWFADAARTSAGEKSWTSAARSEALAGTVLALAGDSAAARPLLRQSAAWAREHAVETRFSRFTAVGLYLAGDREELARFATWMRGAALPTFRQVLSSISHVNAIVLLANGKATAARDTLAGAIQIDSSTYPRVLLALSQEAAGDPAAANSWGRLSLDFGDEEQFFLQLAPYRQGRALEARGDAAGARAAYEAFVARFPADTPPDELPSAVADARARIARLR